MPFEANFRDYDVKIEVIKIKAVQKFRPKRGREHQSQARKLCMILVKRINIIIQQKVREIGLADFFSNFNRFIEWNGMAE